ncbi:MAG TPA: MFS domain-containing histidine kinase [Pyrinomonadaceae bacterium]|nr:MFS domain-containing histidine kinase [Pyrinomonadaceae bacterium]
MLPEVFPRFAFQPTSTDTIELLTGAPIPAAVLAVYSITIGSLLNRFGLRRCWSYLLFGFAVVSAVSLLTAHFLGTVLLTIPLLFSGVLTILLVQVNSLWRLDRQLFRTLVNSPIGAGLQSTGPSTGANTRLMSGLKLLNTMLPLNEAIVFQSVDGAFEAVARCKGSGQTSSDPKRNSVWREGIRLCERAVTSRQLVSETAQGTVAVPLLHESEAAGALLIRTVSEFNNDDKLLLEAIGSQFARNLKRESFSKSPARSQSLAYFSYGANQRKLDALNVLKALTVEQRCEASTLAHIEDGVAIAYLDGTLALANPTLLGFAGLTAERVRTLDLFGLLDHFRTDIFDEPQIAVRRVLQTGIEYEGELKFETKNQILNLRLSLLRDPNTEANEPIGIAVHVRDLTRIKEYEKLKSDMISLMSHELRTPLTSINGFAELLTADDSIPASAREFVTIIANESQRMSRMINTFLAVTQLERKDKQEVLKIPLRLDEVVRETITSLQPTAKKKRIRLIEQPANRIPPVAADKSLITQAVKNLVNNAIKYSPERTTVTVSTALEAETVRVCVEDRGYGIPAEAKERVWDKFYRVVREGQEKDEESTGLGLSFVREVVEQHGGQVELDSEEGRGSKFSFTLPRL